jgi:hypothetical protein
MVDLPQDRKGDGADAVIGLGRFFLGAALAVDIARLDAGIAATQGPATATKTIGKA